jgi:FADH2 O2-dependent halogenase
VPLFTMETIPVDVAVLGSGFAGSLAALGCHKLGLEAVLIDRARHPRFAIGESSTPVANRVLRDLAERYSLPRLMPLAKFGPWQRAYPHLGCGLKRGFSYFHQPRHQPFVPDPQHRNELLVAASADDETSDTQWLRADVDAFLAGEAAAAGIRLFEGVRLADPVRHPAGGWHLRSEPEGLAVHARFVIDGTGEASVMARAMGATPQLERLQTRSRMLFSHFHHVGSWNDWLRDRGGDVANHPFRCDDAAQHMLLDGAWMWLLRFQNNLASVGLAIDERRFPLDPSISPEDEWRDWLRSHPSVGELLANVELAAVPGRMIRSGRIQRRAGAAAGPDWAALPNTAGFIDPLHSTGIGHSLCGLERLLHILGESWGRPELAERLDEYQQILFREIALIDLLVDGCYRSLRSFRAFTAWSMLYFAAATTYEHRRSEAAYGVGKGHGGNGSSGDGGAGYDSRLWFLNADNPEFTATVAALHERIDDGCNDEIAWERTVAAAVRPYNRVGLFDPEAHNLYRYTVAPE